MCLLNQVKVLCDGRYEEEQSLFHLRSQLLVVAGASDRLDEPLPHLLHMHVDALANRMPVHIHFALDNLAGEVDAWL